MTIFSVAKPFKNNPVIKADFYDNLNISSYNKSNRKLLNKYYIVDIKLSSLLGSDIGKASRVCHNNKFTKGNNR